MPVSIEDRGGAARAVLGALAPTAAATIRLGARAGTAAMLGLVDHGELSGGGSQKEHSGYKAGHRARCSSCWCGQQIMKRKPMPRSDVNHHQGVPFASLHCKL